MNRLASHIEILLLENDCVVIPGFGGFIAHNMSALWDKEENLFVPPSRVIGFNSQLKMNDGLLAQSYIRTYKIDYNEANKTIQEEINQLINTFHAEGKVELPFIGEIKYSANESYHFSPYNEKLNSPANYGLPPFTIHELDSLWKKDGPTEIRVPSPERRYTIHPIVKNATAIAAAVLLFLFMPSSLDNTYLENQSYANVFPYELFDKIKNESLLTTQIVSVIDSEQNKQTYQQTPKTQVIPVAVNEIKVPQVEIPKIEEVQKEEHKNHLIVASVNNKADAERMADKLRDKGYSKAKAIVGDEKNRVCIASFATYNEAVKELKELRKIASYKDAWLLVK